MKYKKLKVRCVDPSPIGGLTYGKIYEVINKKYGRAKYYLIKSDSGITQAYNPLRFCTIEETHESDNR